VSVITRKLTSQLTSVLVIFRSFKQPTEWEKTFTRFSSGKTFISIMYKELKKANTKRINNPMTKGQILNRQFSKWLVNT
jgi:hypothetical protein